MLNKKVSRIIIIIVFLLTLFSLDFLRDFVFKNFDIQINYLNHMDEAGYSTVVNYTHSFMEKQLKGYSIMDIYHLKWTFTIVFTVIFYMVGGLFLWFIYNKKAMLFFSYLYAALFVSASLIYSYNFISASRNAYLISLEIMHFLQSSLPSLFMVLSFKIYQATKATP